MNLDPVFKALADPTRRAIVERLASGEASVGELAAPFTMSQPAVSHHLKVLSEAGLISMTRTGRSTSCRLEPGALEDLSAWALDTQRFWRDRVRRLQRRLAASADQGGPDGRADSPLGQRPARGSEGAA